MANITPEKTIAKIQKLYKMGLGPCEIARRTGVSHPTVYGYTKVRQRINPETKKPFESMSQLKDYQIRQRINPETKKPYNSQTEYNKHLAKQKGYSLTEYKKYLTEKRSKRKKNRKLSALIKERLEELGQNQSWLAEQLGVSRESASLYAHGESIPKDEKLEKLFKVLKIPNKPKNLDDLFK